MKVVILAGGYGTRISEESHLRPKPMIEIGEKPILWHIMKAYSAQGFDEFIICAGYKGNMITEYFANYYLYNCDVTFDFSKNNSVEIHSAPKENWKVTVVDTGLATMTGGRVKRIRPYVGNEPFMLTYGDGVSDIDLGKLLAFHKKHGKVGTLSTVNAAQRFGVIEVGDDGAVTAFREKDDDDGALINIGFMVMEPAIFDYIEDDATVFEKTPLDALVSKGQLAAYDHDGFWQCMDTQRDKQQLEQLWADGNAPWKKW